MEEDKKKLGAIRKVGDFLGISKFGRGLATTKRVLTGEVNQDIERLNANTAQVNKITYAASQEKDPIKRKKLLELAINQGKMGQDLDPTKIDSGLNLTNKEILGSAANIGLNILTPGAFKGGKAAIIGKNAALGAGFGAASGMEKNRSLSGIAGSATGGAVIGAGIGAVGIAAKAFKDFLGKTTPEWMMNKAVKPALQDLKKNVKYGTDSLGKELLDEGVKGGPKKLLEIANVKTHELESQLQSAITHPGLKGVKITREQIVPYLKDLVEQKAGTPGMGGDVQRIKNVLDSIPEQMTLSEANIMKRRIYHELRDVSFKLDAKLGTKAATLRQVAKGLKTEIENSVGGTVVRDINQKLSIYGRLENSMVDQLAREMRNNGVGLTDAILLSGGGSTSALALFRHLSKGTATYTAQALNKTGKVLESKAPQGAKELLRRSSFNLP